MSIELSALVDKLFNKTLWHPTTRMRLIQFLFHIYGVDEVAEAIKAKREALQAKQGDLSRLPPSSQDRPLYEEKLFTQKIGSLPHL